MPTGRRAVNLRMSWSGVERIEQRARDEAVVDERGEPNRSEMIRIMIAYADRTMPKGWRPK